MTTTDFIGLCQTLREIGLTDITVGEFSAKFGPAPVKPLPVKPKTRPDELPPEEWREKAARGNR